MLELYLGADTPPVAEIIPQHDYSMGQVDAAVSPVFGISAAVRIAKNVVAIEIVVAYRLAIPSNG